MRTSEPNGVPEFPALEPSRAVEAVRVLHVENGRVVRALSVWSSSTPDAGMPRSGVDREVASLTGVHVRGYGATPEPDRGVGRVHRYDPHPDPMGADGRGLQYPRSNVLAHDPRDTRRTARGRRGRGWLFRGGSGERPFRRGSGDRRRGNSGGILGTASAKEQSQPANGQPTFQGRHGGLLRAGA